MAGMRIPSLLLLAPLALAADHWVGTWGAAPSPPATRPELEKSGLVFSNHTVRQTVHVSLGGKQLRVRLSNAYGSQKTEIGAATVAVKGGAPKPLTFGGRTAVTLPPDALFLSDPLPLDVPAGGDLVVSLYLPKATPAAGIHYGAQQTNQVLEGNQTANAAPTGGRTITSWVFLTGVDVLASEKAGAIVAFGDSITDGARSTVDANRRWPDTLASRLRALNRWGVVDMGIGGNRVLHDAVPPNIRFGLNALARFERDVLAVPGVKYAIILEGINDLGHAGTSAPASETVSADDLIAGYKQMIERAHARGVKVLLGTITPFEGTVFPGYYSPEKDAKRRAINDWIRQGAGFDGVVDFEKAVRDPAAPGKMLKKYDGGDWLHPGDAGYQAMGEAVDLKLFR